MASEMLLQKNLEITEMKTSEARTVAATLANLITVGDGGEQQGSLDAEANGNAAGQVIGVETGAAKEGEACSMQ
jgi:hypothetical protein